MASTISEGIRDILVTNNVGVFNSQVEEDWAIYISREPVDANETSLTVFDTGGATPNPKWLLDYPTIQVRIRGATNGYKAAWEKAKDVKDALLANTPQTINGDKWDFINIAGDINHIGYDEADRPIFTINFRLIIEPATSALTQRAAL